MVVAHVGASTLLKRLQPAKGENRQRCGDTLLMVVANARIVRHVKLNDGEIECPYCGIALVMDAVMPTIFIERRCPSCQEDFMIVYEATPESFFERGCGS